MRNTHHVLDLLPAYALDCLEEAEAIRVSEHLADCVNCQAALVAYQKVVDELPLAAVESTPPPELREKLLTKVRRHSVVPSPARVTWRQRLEPFTKMPFWGAASLALIMVLAINNWFLWRQLGSLQKETPAAFQVVRLLGTEKFPQASGMLVISENGEYGTLVVDSLPRLDEAHKYQLWLIQGEQRSSGGVFSVGEGGYASLWISSPQPLIAYNRFGITIEPLGGSPGPTGDRVLGGDL